MLIFHNVLTFKLFQNINIPFSVPVSVTENHTSLIMLRMNHIVGVFLKDSTFNAKY